MPLRSLAGVPYPTPEIAAEHGARHALLDLLEGSPRDAREILDAAWMYAGEHSARSPLKPAYVLGYLAGLGSALSPLHLQ